MMHNYTFDDGKGTTLSLTSSNKLKEKHLNWYIDNVGGNWSHDTEPFDRVEQTFQEVAEQLQVELDQMTARVARLEQVIRDVRSLPCERQDEGDYMLMMALMQTPAAALRQGKS